MRRRSFGYALLLVTSILLPSPAHAALIGTLEVVSPLSVTYTEGVHFDVFTLSGTGDVIARLAAVDLSVPPPAGLNTTTSGCEAADFAGFAAGSIALLQRGTCTFEVKVARRWRKTRDE